MLHTRYCTTKTCKQQRVLKENRRATCRAVKQERVVKLIATDVDGTLLTHRQELSSIVEKTVRRATDRGVPVVVATGKARGPWAKDVLPRLGPKAPGVFLQGLLVCDGDGKVLFSRELEADVVNDVISIAKVNGLTLTAYCNDRILCEAIDEHTDRLLFYKEPTPEPVGPLNQVVGKIAIQKMIFMAEQEKLDRLRPEIEKKFAGRASITTAITGMLEILPHGASKGAGLKWLLEYLKISPQDVMAMGDGENDIEMLEMVGLSVAMGNAGERVKQVADVVVATNDNDGVAQAIEQFVLQPRNVAAL